EQDSYRATIHLCWIPSENLRTGDFRCDQTPPSMKHCEFRQSMMWSKNQPKDSDVTRLLLLAMFLSCPLLWAYDCPANQPKDGDTLLQIEQKWAKALQQKNADAVACIIGARSEDARTDG